MNTPKINYEQLHNDFRNHQVSLKNIEEFFDGDKDLIAQTRDNIYEVLKSHIKQYLDNDGLIISKDIIAGKENDTTWDTILNYINNDKKVIQLIRKRKYFNVEDDFYLVYNKRLGITSLGFSFMTLLQWEEIITVVNNVFNLREIVLVYKNHDPKYIQERLVKEAHKNLYTKFEEHRIYLDFIKDVITQKRFDITINDNTNEQMRKIFIEVIDDLVYNGAVLTNKDNSIILGSNNQYTYETILKHMKNDYKKVLDYIRHGGSYYDSAYYLIYLEKDKSIATWYELEDKFDDDYIDDEILLSVIANTFTYE